MATVVQVDANAAVVERPDSPRLYALSSRLPASSWVDRCFALALFVRRHARLPRRAGGFNDRLFFLRWDGAHDSDLCRRISDKLTAKDYIAERVGPLAPRTLAVLRSEAELLATEIPVPSILKPSFSSGRVCALRSPATPKLRRHLARWLGEDFYLRSREPQYRGLEKAILVEELIEFDGVAPANIRVFCFAGRAQMIAVSGDGRCAGTRNYYGRDWRLLPFTSRHPRHRPSPPPPNLARMLAVAERLAAPFPLLRVDFYSDGLRLLVGELTLNPGNANQSFRPAGVDGLLGRLFDGVEMAELLPELQRLGNRSGAERRRRRVAPPPAPSVRPPVP